MLGTGRDAFLEELIVDFNMALIFPFGLLYDLSSYLLDVAAPPDNIFLLSLYYE